MFTVSVCSVSAISLRVYKRLIVRFIWHGYRPMPFRAVKLSILSVSRAFFALFMRPSASSVCADAPACLGGTQWVLHSEKKEKRGYTSLSLADRKVSFTGRRYLPMRSATDGSG